MKICHFYFIFSVNDTHDNLNQSFKVGTGMCT